MTTKTILAGTLTAAALALGGGVAYAATSGGPAGHAPAVTSTVTTVQHAQHPATWPGHGNCCHITGKNAAARPAAGTTTPAALKPGNSHTYRCDHGNGHSYHGSGQYTWKNGSWRCGH